MKILGLDYGRKKIGVALGDTETKLSFPLQVIPLINWENQINNLLKENEIKKVVLGLTGGKIDKTIQEFGEQFTKKTEIPVEYFDETLTTQEAQKLLIETGGKRKNRQGKEDAVAAALMLQYYLERGETND